jgi:hypothetical protein
MLATHTVFASDVPHGLLRLRLQPSSIVSKAKLRCVMGNGLMLALHGIFAGDVPHALLRLRAQPGSIVSKAEFRCVV